MKSKQKNQYSAKGILNKIIFGLSITIMILLLIIFLTTDTKEIINSFKSINVPYLFAAIGMTFLYFVLSPITTCILTRAQKCDISMLDAYLISNTEHFFNGITPFATGGQPFQVYSYSRLGVKASQSTGILMMNFIIFMAVTNLFALLSITIYPELIKAVGNLLPMIIIGFTMNFLSFGILLLLATNKAVANFLVKALTALAKIKFLHKLITPVIPAFQKYCTDTQTAFKQLWKNKGAAASCFVIKSITMLVYYAITFYILRAFNINCSYSDIFFVVCGTSFAITTCVFIPTPGGSGGIEFAFTSIFVFIASGITKDQGASGMLLWRMLTYYGLMLISFADYLVLEHRTKKYQSQLPPLMDVDKTLPTCEDDSNNDSTERPSTAQNQL